LTHGPTSSSARSRLNASSSLGSVPCTKTLCLLPLLFPLPSGPRCSRLPGYHFFPVNTLPPRTVVKGAPFFLPLWLFLYVGTSMPLLPAFVRPTTGFGRLCPAFFSSGFQPYTVAWTLALFFRFPPKNPHPTGDLIPLSQPIVTPHRLCRGGSASIDSVGFPPLVVPAAPSSIFP